MVTWYEFVTQHIISVRESFESVQFSSNLFRRLISLTSISINGVRVSWCIFHGSGYVSEDDLAVLGIPCPLFSNLNRRTKQQGYNPFVLQLSWWMTEWPSDHRLLMQCVSWSRAPNTDWLGRVSRAIDLSRARDFRPQTVWNFDHESLMNWFWIVWQFYRNILTVLWLCEPQATVSGGEGVPQEIEGQKSKDLRGRRSASAASLLQTQSTGWLPLTSLFTSHVREREKWKVKGWPNRVTPLWLVYPLLSTNWGCLSRYGRSPGSFRRSCHIHGQPTRLQDFFFARTGQYVKKLINMDRNTCRHVLLC